jgi:alkylation response protein AidB-like acyl-CoA dehydrogenase
VDFQISEAQKMLRTSAREFIEKEIAPVATECERLAPPSRELIQEVMKRLVPLGYLGTTLSEEYGGAGLDGISYGILLEELARISGGLALGTMVQGGMARTLCEGSEHLKGRFLSPTLSADIIGCGCITEPNIGSGIADLETEAVLDGDCYIVNGTKTWVTNGGIADIALVFVSTDRTKGPHWISAIVIEKGSSPFEVRELHKVGLHSSSTAELFFQDCRVPVENLLGEEGRALPRLFKAFELTRATLAMISVGIAQAAIDASVQYARERRQFGKLIGGFQLVQEMIVDMVTQVDAARLLAFRVLDFIDRNIRARKEAAMAKAYAVEIAVDVTSKAMAIHGAYGLSTEYALERYFRDAKTMTVPDGTTGIQKLIAGRDITGCDAFA